MIKTLMNNWRALRMPMTAVTVSLAVLCSLIFFARHDQGNQNIRLNTAKTAYNNTQQKLQLSKLEQQHIAQYLPQYQQLLQVGFVGEERREEWVAQLRKVRAQYHLFNIAYEIAQQQIYQPTFIGSLQHYVVYRSVMTLKLKLLHEHDLVRLITGLREQSSPFMVRDCEVIRLADFAHHVDKLEGALQAQCEIDWIKVKAHT